jgi:hypothetical protein
MGLNANAIGISLNANASGKGLNANAQLWSMLEKSD